MKQKFVYLAALLLAVCLVFCACSKEEGTPDAVIEALKSAEQLYAEGEYEASLESYLNAMDSDMKNMDARLGVIRCQIALGNYDVADMNIAMALQIDPSYLELCELLLEMTQQTGEMYYAQQAVSVAREYGYDSILENIPAPPEFGTPEGNYSEKVLLDITCSDPEADIIVSLSNSENGSFNLYEDIYLNPFLLIRGTNTVTAYSRKNGVPSEAVTIEYTVNYEETEVAFQEPMIEKLVREQLGKPNGPITNYECEQVTMLDWYNLYYSNGNYNWFYNQRLKSLEDLKHLPSLNYLLLYYQDKLTDFSPLQYCPMLWQVNLSYCSIQDASFAQYLSNVYYLNLDGNEISDFTGLERFKDLQSLNVQDNAGGTIDRILEACKYLTEVSFDDDMLSDYNLLAVRNVNYCNIQGLAYVDYAALGNLTDLVSLSISFDYDRREHYTATIDDASFLQNMTNLQSLNLSGLNDPSALEYIKNLKNLTYLYLYNSPFANDSAAMQSLMYALPNCAIYY